MNYKEFKEKIEEKVRSYMFNEDKNYNVKIIQQHKNNGVLLDGILISNNENVPSPVVYLNNLYKQYENGVDLEEIVKKIVDTKLSNKNIEKMDLDWVTKFNIAKDYLICKIINKKNNDGLLKTLPHKCIEDLAITYHLLLDNHDGMVGTIKITNDILEVYGIDIDTLHEKALENMKKITPSVFKSFLELFEDNYNRANKIKIEDSSCENEEIKFYCDDREELEDSKEEREIYCDLNKMCEDMFKKPLYVLTNSRQYDGAAAILDKEMLLKISQIMKDNFYIIPSSIHEVIIVSKGFMEYEEYEKMIKDINEEHVSIEERLSDHLYEYDIESGTIILASRLACE